MTRIITKNPTIEQIDQFEKSLAGDDTQWEGTDFGLNLRDILAYARDGLRERDRNFAQGQEMEDFIANGILVEAYSHDKYCFCDICTDAKAMLPAEEEDTLLEQFDVLQGAWGRNIDAIKSICSQTTENEDWKAVQEIRQGKRKLPGNY